MVLAGDKVRASDLDAIVRIVRKSASESITNSTTLQDDDDLQISVEASVIYTFRSVIFYDASTTGDLKFQWVAPSGAALAFSAMIPALAITAAAGNTTNFGSFNLTDVLGVGAAGVGTQLAIAMNGVLVMSTTAGTFKLQWAQNTADAVNATRLFANSYIELTEII